jgi:hypothetical protein
MHALKHCCWQLDHPDSITLLDSHADRNAARLGTSVFLTRLLILLSSQKIKTRTITMTTSKNGTYILFSLALEAAMKAIRRGPPAGPRTAATSGVRLGELTVARANV